MLKKKLLAAASAFLMLFTGSFSVYALRPDSERVHDGIDISEYQGDVNFDELKNCDIKTVYIRAAAGDYTDSEFENNSRKAKEAGIKFGYYFYVTARNAEEARRQAERFADLIRNKDYSCRPAMDFEEFSGLSRREINEIGTAFMERLHELIYTKPMIYTDAFAADSIWDENFAEYPLWAADYGAYEPDITRVFTNGWSGFQFTDDGRVCGVDDAVDRDRFTDTVYITDNENENRPDENFIYYRVKAGDTLYDIARRFDTTVEEIARENRITNVNLIFVGEVLRIKR